MAILESNQARSFFRLLDPSPIRESVFYVVCRIKIPKKIKFFIWQISLGQVNTLDRLAMTSLMGSFCCILCWKVEEDLDHLLWNCQCEGRVEFLVGVWCLDFWPEGYSCDDRGVFLHLPFGERPIFCGLVGGVLCCGIFWWSGTIECLELGIGTLARFGP